VALEALYIRTKICNGGYDWLFSTPTLTQRRVLTLLLRPTNVEHAGLHRESVLGRIE
jgi:hypothetical protein